MKCKCKNSQEINSGHYIELMDRLHITLCNVGEYVIDHPISCANSDVRVLLQAAGNSLMSAYELVSQIERVAYTENKLR